MFILLVILHIIVCLFLVGVVLIQQGKSADLAGAFGGQGSQTAFGPRGAANLLTRLTTWSAIIFMLTSIALTVVHVARQQQPLCALECAQPVNACEEVARAFSISKAQAFSLRFRIFGRLFERKELPMIRETLAVGLLGCNCSILGDELSREAIVVDPGYDIPRILALLAKHKLTVTKILITHAHIDHIASALQLKEITGAPILYSQADLPLVAMMDAQAGMFGLPVPTVLPPDHSPADGEAVDVGGDQGKRAVHARTFGRQPVSLCAGRASAAGGRYVVCRGSGPHRFAREEIPGSCWRVSTTGC